jgi:PEGA domain-containing protein
MLRRTRFLALGLLLLSLSVAAKDDGPIVMFWPNQNNATLKLSFGRFRSLGSFEGRMSLLSEVIIENVSDKPMAKASMSVYLLDKDHVRIGDGLLVISDVNPGESVKVQLQCSSVGPPVALSVVAKNASGGPSSLKLVPLQIISDPPGAGLKINGKDQGYTPTTVNLSAGTYKLELQKEGYAVTTTPLDVAADDLPNGSIKITLAGLSTDLVLLRDGTSLAGDVVSLDFDSVVIKVAGKDQKVDRNQVNRIFLVERQTTHTITSPELPKTVPTTQKPQ